MIRFIFKMLFIGTFLGIVASVFMWLVYGWSFQKSINWLLNRTTHVVREVKNTDVDIESPGKTIDKVISKVNHSL